MLRTFNKHVPSVIARIWLVCRTRHEKGMIMLCTLQVLGFHAEMPEGLPIMEIQNLAKP